MPSFRAGLIARSAMADTTPPNTLRALPGAFRLDAPDITLRPPIVIPPTTLACGTGAFALAGESMTTVTAFALPAGVGAFALIDPGTTKLTPPADASGWTISQNTIEVTKQIRFKAGSLTAMPIFANTSASMYSSETSQFNVIENIKNRRLNQVIYSANLNAWTYSYIADGARYGMPIELIVRTANELNVGPHICIPHMACDDYVTQVATYVKNNLNSSLVATFEYSNEVWNTSFNQTTYSIKREQMSGWPNDNGNYWYGYRFYQVMTLIGAVFSGQMSRINRAMACKCGNYGAGANDNRFNGISGTGLPAMPITLADSIHIAPYYEADRYTVSDAQMIWQYNHGTAPQKAAAITWLDNFMRDDGAVFSGTVTGTGMTIHVNSITSGELINAPFPHGILGTGVPANCKIVSISGSTVTVDQNLGALTTRTFSTGSGNFTVKWLRDVVFPAWKAIANAPAAGVTNLKLEQYEGGGGQLGSLKPNSTTVFNRTTGTHATWNGVDRWVNAYNPGSGLVDITYAEQANFFAGYLASPEWAATLKLNWDNFIAAGGTTPAQYTMLSPWSNGAEWGVINGDILTGTRTPAYTALVAYRG